MIDSEETFAEMSDRWWEEAIKRERILNAKWLLTNDYWRLDPQTQTLIYPPHHYDVKLDQLNTPEKLWHWIAHTMTTKNWGPEAVGALIRACFIFFGFLSAMDMGTTELTLTGEHISKRIAEILWEAA